MKTKLILLQMILTTMFGFRATAQETGGHRISGGTGYFMAGYSWLNLKNMNAALTENGYPKLTNGSVTFGGGGNFVYKNLIFGGEGHGINGTSASNTGYDVNINGGYGFFNFGYMAYHTPGVFIYPLLGLGGGGTTIGIIPKDRYPQNFDDLLNDPARQSWITSGGFMMNFSLSADFLVAGAKTDTSSGGWFLGIKAGYIASFSNSDWKMGNMTIPGSPDAGISGPYVRISLGGGSFGK